MESINSNTSNTNGATGNGASVSVMEASTPPSTPAGSVALPGPAKVKVGFTTTDTDAELIVDTDRIVTAMTGNKSYPAPLPTLADLNTARAAFVAAVSAAHGNRIGVATRRELRKELVAQLRMLAHYVQVACAGNLPVLLSSGFPAQGSRTPVGELPPPENVRVVRGKVSGQVVARCRRVKRASAYQWRIAATATPTVWQQVVTTAAASTVFDGLTPLTSYVVQVCMVGTAGLGNWSDAVTVIAL